MFAENTGWETAPRKLHQCKPQAQVTRNIYIKNRSLTWSTALRANSNPAWEFIGFIISCQLKLWPCFLCSLGHEGKCSRVRAGEISPSREGGFCSFWPRVWLPEAKTFLFTHRPFQGGKMSPPRGEWDRIFAFSSWGLILETHTWLMQVISLPTWNLLRGFSSHRGGKGKGWWASSVFTVPIFTGLLLNLK